MVRNLNIRYLSINSVEDLYDSFASLVAVSEIQEADYWSSILRRNNEARRQEPYLRTPQLTGVSDAPGGEK
jgi:hypothetical protein